MYVNAAVCVVWFMVVAGMTKVNNLKSMSFSLAGFSQSSANKMRDALLSINGVIEAVVIEGEEVAYLKVDSDQLDILALEDLPKPGIQQLMAAKDRQY